jgi:hypothetical protein
MRKLFVMMAAIAAASCGGNSSNLSGAEAQSVASELSAALQSHEAVAMSPERLLIGPFTTSVTYTCAEGKGELDVSGSLSINCPSGLRSCATTGSLKVDALACRTSTGAVINGSLLATVTGTGLSFTKTVSGEISVTRPDGTTATCAVDVTVTFGHLSGTVCGVPVHK